MRLLWEEEAWEDYCLWQTRDKKLLKRINSLIKDIQRNTYELCNSIIFICNDKCKSCHCIMLRNDRRLHFLKE